MSEQELNSAFTYFLSGLRTFIRTEVQNELRKLGRKNQEMPNPNSNDSFNALHGMDVPPQVYNEQEPE